MPHSPVAEAARSILRNSCYHQDLKPDAPPSGASEDLSLVEPEETLLFGAYLLHVDLIEARFDVLADGLEVLLGVGPAGDGHHLLGDERGRLLEVSRGSKLLGELAGELLVGPEPVRGLASRRYVLAPADLRARVGGFVPAA